MKYKVRLIGWSDTWAALSKLSTPSERLTLGVKSVYPSFDHTGQAKGGISGCPDWPARALSCSPNRPFSTFFPNSQATAVAAAEGRWDHTPTRRNFCSHRETGWSQRIMWSKSMTLPWGRASPRHCQQFLQSAQWEKLMALLVFPIFLSHFLLSFARLLFSLPPEALVGLQCAFALLQGITSSLAQHLKGPTHTAKSNYLASFPHGVPPHRCDLTRSLTKK